MASKIENNTLYRFRSIDSLLGEKYQELERQSIFFAPPELLNDPMEGFRDIHFKGDDVLWGNLFKHYLASLIDMVITYFIIGEDEDIDGLVETFSPEEIITEKLGVCWKEVVESFFNEESIGALITNIVKYRAEVSQTELSFYLCSIHPFAIKCIFEHLLKKDIKKSELYEVVDIEWTPLVDCNFFEFLKEMNEEQREFKIDSLLLKFNLHAQQMRLIIKDDGSKRETNKKFLFTDFPFVYTRKLEGLMYPNWFTACFMSKATNSSVWGNYGDNHAGVCLIFNVEFNENNKSYLTLGNDAYYSESNEPIMERSSLSFYKVRYTHKQEPLNFFESIGQLAIPKVNKQWLTNKDGVRSKYFSSFNAKWRKKYWDSFYIPITKKGQDWKIENEYRLILNDPGDLDSQQGTTLNYEFTSLKGIIFGINTSYKHKLMIFKIIEKKVHLNNHYDFKFYQAYYCKLTGEIKHAELILLKFNKQKKTD